MAPEQLRAGRVTRQTDVHAFATVLWEMIAGRRLFAGETEADTIARVVQHVIPSVGQYAPGVGPEVDVVLQKGLAESLEVRYASARDMCIALGSCGPTASTMQVADWVQSQVHDLIERRAEVVSAIERNQEHSNPTESARSDSDSGSAKDWVRQLSQPDLEAAAKQSSPASPTQGAETSISAVMDSVLDAKRPKPWGQIAAGGLGVLGLAFGIFSWNHRASEPPRAPATESTTVPAPPSPLPSPPAPSATASAATTAPSAAPVSTGIAQAPPPDPSATSRPARVPPTAAAARPPTPARNPPPARHDNVFDSRE